MPHLNRKTKTEEEGALYAGFDAQVIPQPRDADVVFYFCAITGAPPCQKVHRPVRYVVLGSEVRGDDGTRYGIAFAEHCHRHGRAHTTEDAANAHAQDYVNLAANKYRATYGIR